VCPALAALCISTLTCVHYIVGLSPLTRVQAAAPLMHSLSVSFCGMAHNS
jgi:hypothetical protein